MSVQFGKCNFDGQPVDPHDLDEVRSVLAPYGPDSEGHICKDNYGIIYRAFHTTKESRSERQPQLSRSGAFISWDGRLDNREDLIKILAGDLSSDSTDLEVVGAGHERWGSDVFRELIGDWALSIWNPKDQSLILAKDFIGTRNLFYSVQKDQVTWCTILDPLVLFAGRSFRLEEEYIAGWVSFFPATHLTPYVGIHAVPPSCFVRLTRGAQSISKYWDFDPAKRIHYGTDCEYEEHFRVVLSESVRRRLRSDSPVLAELSGGMDSTSIVCTADKLAGRDSSGTRRLKTVSYYDDTEPNWDERSYFTKVEAERGQTGFHIDVGKQEFLAAEAPDRRFASIPEPVYQSLQARKEFAACLHALGSRTLLCGIGGDEVTGGVPTPVPEFQDLLARAQLRRFAHALKTWALHKRKPWFHLFFEAVGGFLPSFFSPTPEARRPAPWLNPSFASRTQLALLGYPSRAKVFGSLPSFQENIATVEALRRQLGCDVPNPELIFETRYPYLDRGLLEFLLAIPRDQLVRPGQRRSLMRRALVGIVPDEVLNRKRKAYVSRTPMAALSAQYASLVEMSQRMATSAWGITNSAAVCEALQRARDGLEGRIVQLIRTMEVEAWLRQTTARNVFSVNTPSEKTRGLQLARQTGA
jgi:asparagine synthase (glutamine-hydrolysing)